MRMSLANMNVLVVEDEALVAMMVENWLASFGVSEVNVCCDLGSALAASSEQRPDLALVDINLGGVKSYPLIERLWEMKVPVLLATGYSLSLIHI